MQRDIISRSRSRELRPEIIPSRRRGESRRAGENEPGGGGGGGGGTLGPLARLPRFRDWAPT